MSEAEPPVASEPPLVPDESLAGAWRRRTTSLVGTIRLKWDALKTSAPYVSLYTLFSNNLMQIGSLFKNLATPPKALLSNTSERLSRLRRRMTSGEPLQASTPRTPTAKEIQDANHRAQVAKEILMTERSYLGHLETMEKIFFPALRDALGASRSADAVEDELSFLFGNVPQLAALSRQFLESLEPAIERDQVGVAFSTFGPFFKLYAAFCDDYTARAAALKTLRESSKSVRAALEKVAAENPSALTLESTLVMPVQRVPRYVLLLTEINKHMPADHPDREKCALALEAMKRVADHINESIRTKENAQKLYNVHSSLVGNQNAASVLSKVSRSVRSRIRPSGASSNQTGGDWNEASDENPGASSANSLGGSALGAESGVSNASESSSSVFGGAALRKRTFVREGGCWRIDSRGNKKRLTCFLFSDRLVYGRPDPTDITGKVLFSKHIEPKHVSESVPGLPLALCVGNVKDEYGTLVLLFSSMEEKTSWLGDLMRVSASNNQDNASKPPTFIMTDGRVTSLQPVIPDVVHSRCSSCAIRFGASRKRKTCRDCGRGMCESCVLDTRCVACDSLTASFRGNRHLGALGEDDPSSSGKSWVELLKRYSRAAATPQAALALATVSTALATKWWAAAGAGGAETPTFAGTTSSAWELDVDMATKAAALFA